MAAAAAVLAAAVGAGMVMAQSQDDGTGIDFLGRVAEKLGVDRPKLDQAIQDARSDQLDEAVANGDLTQKQADALKERLDELPGDAPFIAPGFGHKFGEDFAFGFGGDGGFAFKFAFGGHGAGFESADLAEFLGIDEAQLGEELQADGATLVTVAQAHGKSRDELKAFISDGVKTRLDEAVAAGDLTPERADEIVAKFNDHLDRLIDGEFGGKPFGRGFKSEFGFGGPHLGIGFASDEMAQFLGVEQPQLVEELQADGATLATVAEAHGKSRDELKGFITAGLKTKLDTAVADGDPDARTRGRDSVRL
jgi:hypothetical protein